MKRAHFIIHIIIRKTQLILMIKIIGNGNKLKLITRFMYAFPQILFAKKTVIIDWMINIIKIQTIKMKQGTVSTISRVDWDRYTYKLIFSL